MLRVKDSFVKPGHKAERFKEALTIVARPARGTMGSTCKKK
jgi:hypothetical protein